jgi:hypothetical protein
MGIIGKDFNYKKVENFLTNEEIKLFEHYCKDLHFNNRDNFDITIPTVDSYYKFDPLFESLLHSKQQIVEKLTGKKLLPTYSYWRMYTNHATLFKHTDRPACEISVTINICSDGTPWPIYMNETPIDLTPGQAAIYLGEKIPHERKIFKGDYYAQCFIHYVDAEGKNTDQFLDKRPHIYNRTPR